MEVPFFCLLLCLIAVVGARHGEDGRSLARIASFGWSTERYSLSRTEPSTVTMLIQVTPSSGSDEISGQRLWEVGVFASRHEDGSGNRYNQKRNILSRQQEQYTMRPGRTMEFEVEFEFPMGQVGCDGTRYFCVEFSKGGSASPNFDLTSQQGNDGIVKCREMTCQFQDQGDTRRALLSNIGFAAGSGPNTPPRGKSNMDITATIVTNPHSDEIRGRGLWRVGVFGSRNQDGSGQRRNEVPDILSDSAASTPLIPGRDLVLPANYDLNLQGIGTGEDFPYFCMEFAKGDSPNPDFELPITGGSIVSCSSMQGTPVASGNPVAMLTGFRSLYSLGEEHSDGTTDLTVEATVIPHDDSDRIQGNNLWKLGTYGSTNQDGTGTRYPISDQMLRPPATDKTLYPGRALVVEGTKNVDLRAIGPDTHYPYLCIEFGKDTRARPPYDLQLGGQETVVTCHQMQDSSHQGGGDGMTGPHGGGSPHGGQDRNLPNALLSQFGYEIGTRPVSGSHLTETRITATVTPMRTTDTITGNNLWRLGVFGNQHLDGSGPRYAEQRQLLPPEQRDNPLYPDRDLVVEGTGELDLRNIGEGTPYPYLCVEFARAREGSNAVFNMPMSTPSGTFLACRPYTPTPSGGGHGGGDPDLPNAIFRSFRTSISPTAVSGSHLTELDIEATVIPHDSTDYIPDAMFRLGVFGSRNQDGSGPRRNEETQVLARNEQTHPVYAGRDVELAATKQLDMRGIGEGTSYPYICLEFDRKNENVGFNMPMSTPTGTFIACQTYRAPDPHEGPGPGPDSNRPQARISNFRSNFQAIPSHGGLTETTIEATITPADNSDNIPVGDNWRMGIFGSQNQDGSGRRKKEVTQLLSQNQRREPLYPRRPLDFEVTTQLDLSGIGTGTTYPYICIEIDRASHNAAFDMPLSTPTGTIVSCSEYSPDEGPHPEPEPHDQRVVVTEVTPDKNVKVREKGTEDVTFDVVVDVDPATSSDVHGSNLWVLKVFASKSKNGGGPRVGEISQALSGAQQSQRIQNGRRLAFRDITATLDLTGVKCNNAKFLCAEIMKGSNRDFEIVGENDRSTVGCAKLKCKSKKKKKEKEPTGRSLTISSIRPSRVTIFEDGRYTVDFTAPIEFVGDQSEPLTRGIDLWKMSAWFNKDPNGVKKIGLIDQVLTTSNKRNKYVRNPSSPFGFGNIEVEFDLSGYNCKKLKYFCVKLNPDTPNPPFTLRKAADDANMGCVRTTCRKRF